MKLPFKLIPTQGLRIPSYFRKSFLGIHKKTRLLHLEDRIGISFGEQELRISLVVSKLTGERHLTEVFNLNTQGLNEEEIALRVKTMIDGLKLKNPRLYGLVPAHLAVTRNIEIPSHDPDEIREILNLQATRHTPYARNEIIVEYINLGIFKTVYTKILFIIVPRTAVACFYDLASRVNLKPERIIFTSEAVARFLWKHVLSSEKLPVSIVQVDSITTEFLIVFRGMLLFVRSIPIGSRHFAAAKEGYLSRFLDELKKSLETYQSENIDTLPTQMLITGAIQGLENLEQLIEEKLQIPVRQIMELEVVPMEADLKTRLPNPNFSSLLHLSTPALMADELMVDLSPEENKLKKALAERSKEVVKSGILVMTLLGLICISLISQIYFKTAKINELKKRYLPIQKEAASLEEGYVRVRAIKLHLAMRGKSLETLAELSSFLSNDLYFTDIKFDADGKINLKGTSYSKPSIFSLVDKIESSTLFRNVQTKYITGRIEEDKELADFELSANLE